MLNNIHYWIWLAELLPRSKARAVCDHFGSPEQAFFSDPAALDRVDFLNRDQIKALQLRDLKRAEDIVQRCERLGVRAVCLRDTEYPDRLLTMPDPPLVLYLAGKSLHLDNRAVIGMVGARAVSSYGRQLAAAFAQGIALGGGVVATGIVPGCDAIAADNAIRAGGLLALVVPGGVDVPHRSSEESRRLLANAPAVGCILSAEPPGVPSTPPRFLYRNELLIALSSAILCVEGAKDSGAVKIARLASEAGRDVCVPPANLTSPHAEGSNALLSAHLARPVVSPQDLLAPYVPLLLPARAPEPGMKLVDIRPTAATKPAAARQAPAPRPPKAERQGAKAEKAPPPREKGVDTVSNTGYIELLEPDRVWTEQERSVLQVLQEGVTSVETLIARTGMNAGSIGGALVMLVVEGVIEELPGGRYRLLPKGRNSLHLS